jgi:hypothetical protein
LLALAGGNRDCGSGDTFASPVGQKSGRHVWKKFLADAVGAGGLPWEGIYTLMNGKENMLADRGVVCQHMLQYKTCRKSFVIASSCGSRLLLIHVKRSSARAVISAREVVFAVQQP